MDESVEAGPSVHDNPFDTEQILREAQRRWFRPEEICKIIQNYEKFGITSEPPDKPQSGSVFLFDRNVRKQFRKDGHNWKKKEGHKNLEAGSAGKLNCYYAHGQENENIQRRRYWMLQGGLSHITFVHYRKVTGKHEDFSCVKEAQVAVAYSKGQDSVEIMPNSNIDSSMCPGPHPNNCQGLSVSGNTDKALLPHGPQALKRENAQSEYNRQASSEFHFGLELQQPAAEQIDAGGSDPKVPLFYSNSDPSRLDMGSSDTETDGTHDLWTCNGSTSLEHENAQSEYNHQARSGFHFGLEVQQPAVEQIDAGGSDLEVPLFCLNSIHKALSTIPDVELDPTQLNRGNSDTDAELDNLLRTSIDPSILEDNWESVTPCGEPIEHGSLSSSSRPDTVGKFVSNNEFKRQDSGGHLQIQEKLKASVEGSSSLLESACDATSEGKLDVQDINAAENYSDIAEANLLLRFDKILCSGFSATNPVTGSLEDATQLSSKISSLLKEDNKDLDQMKTGSGMEFCLEKLKDQLLQKHLKEKLHVWISQKVAEGGDGPCILDKGGLGVLHLAAALGYDWALEPTIVAGVSVDFRDVNGWTALQWAAFCGREHTVASLISLGAATSALTHPSPKYPLGRTPADLASVNEHKGIAGYPADCSLNVHIPPINLDHQDDAAGPKAVQKISEISAATLSLGNASDGPSEKDSSATRCDNDAESRDVCEIYLNLELLKDDSESCPPYSESMEDQSLSYSSHPDTVDKSLSDSFDRGLDFNEHSQIRAESKVHPDIRNDNFVDSGAISEIVENFSIPFDEQFDEQLEMFARGPSLSQEKLDEQSLGVPTSSINLDNQDDVGSGPKAVQNISEISTTAPSVGNTSDGLQAGKGMNDDDFGLSYESQEFRGKPEMQEECQMHPNAWIDNSMENGCQTQLSNSAFEYVLPSDSDAYLKMEGKSIYPSATRQHLRDGSLTEEGLKKLDNSIPWMSEMSEEIGDVTDLDESRMQYCPGVNWETVQNGNGNAGYLADLSLDVHVPSVNLDHHDDAAGPEAVQKISEISAAPPSLRNASDGQSQKDSLAPTCDAATAQTVLTKIVLKLNLCCEKGKTKALKLAAGLEGVHSIALALPLDKKTTHLHVIGAGIDPEQLVMALRRRIGFAELVSVGPATRNEDKDDEEGPDKDNDKGPDKDEGPDKEKQEGKKRAPDPALEGERANKISKAHLAFMALLTAYYNVQSTETIQMLVLVFVGALKKIGERKLSHINDGFELSAIRVWGRKHWRN